MMTEPTNPDTNHQRQRQLLGCVVPVTSDRCLHQFKQHLRHTRLRRRVSVAIRVQYGMRRQTSMQVKQQRLKDQLQAILGPYNLSATLFNELIEISTADYASIEARLTATRCLLEHWKQQGYLTQQDNPHDPAQTLASPPAKAATSPPSKCYCKIS